MLPLGPLWRTCHTASAVVAQRTLG